MLGPKSVHAARCFDGNFIGADYGIAEDLTGKLSEEWRDFNAAYIPVYLANRPGKTKIAAGLACGFVWTVGRGIKVGDIVMFDWNDNNSLDHVQIVSAVENVNGQIKIKMVGHNEDSDYRDLDEAITVDHPGGIGHFWSLSK